MQRTPFKIEVPQADLDDLRTRLRNTRWPDPETPKDDSWSQGTPLAYVQSLCETWANDYDWRGLDSRPLIYGEARLHAADGAAAGCSVLTRNALATGFVLFLRVTASVLGPQAGRHVSSKLRQLASCTGSCWRP